MKLELLLCLPALLGVALLAHAAEEPWFKRHLVGMEVGPTGSQFGPMSCLLSWRTRRPIGRLWLFVTA